ncbi:MAG: prolyl oligopeptidase family serine peptidase [Sphingorhabdus sp.]
MKSVDIRTLMFSAMIICLPAKGVMAQSEGPLAPVNLGDFFEVKRADDPQIARDARHVAFTEIRANAAEDRWQTRVQVVSTTSEPPAITLPQQGDSMMPRWSADGRLAYVRFGKNGAEIVVHEGATIALEGSPIDFAWSPDGRTIAFLSRLGLPLRAPVAQVTGAMAANAPSIYSSAGFQEVNDMLPRNAADYAVYTVPSEGGAPQRITASRVLGEALPYTRPSIVWTPEGSRLLLSLNLAPDGYLNLIQGLLYAVDAKSGAVTRHAGVDGGAYFNPSFAADGTLGLSCRAPSTQNLIRFEFCINAPDSSLKSQAPEIDSLIYPARIAPDGKGFFGVYGERGHGRLAWFGANGKREILAQTGGGDANAYVDGGALTVARDGTVAFLLSDGRTPSEVAIVKRGGRPRTLTSLNTGYIQSRQINLGAEITYSPTDGSMDVGAFLYIPSAREAGAKPPGIVMLHGGQSSDYGPDFDLVPQIFAAHGYMTILPNYRGSGTYGRAFANVSSGSPADREHDVIGAADALVAAGADPDRLFVLGGSGGGMITGWTIGRTKRFRAAVMWYPVTEWWNYAMEAATGPTSRTSFRRWPWEDPAEYVSRSPYAQIGEIGTPTMLIVGDRDRITPISGAIAFFRALRVRGVESELVVYPGAAHGIDGVPSQAMGHIAETLGWLAKHGGNPIIPPELPDATSK